MLSYRFQLHICCFDMRKVCVFPKNVEFLLWSNVTSKELRDCDGDSARFKTLNPCFLSCRGCAPTPAPSSNTEMRCSCMIRPFITLKIWGCIPFAPIHPLSLLTIIMFQTCRSFYVSFAPCSLRVEWKTQQQYRCNNSPRGISKKTQRRTPTGAWSTQHICTAVI